MIHADDERIFIDAKINGQSVHFAFDTGTDVPFLLTSTAAEKLNLKVAQPSADARIGPGETRIGWTDSQEADFGFTNIETRFAVAGLPAYLKWDLDGMIGWPAFRNNVLFLDCVTHAIDTFTNRAELTNGWVKCLIQTNSDLTLQLPSGDNTREVIALDTGTSYGVMLNRRKWREWKAIHANQQMTMEAYYTPGAGLVVAEESWAAKISLGGQSLTAVPVTQADSAAIALHSSPQTDYAATLGFAALKRLDIVLDGKQGVVWLRPKKEQPTPYAHNHLGAVFVPQNLESDDLIAHVADGSPATEAGIRNDDILMKIGMLDCTKWRTDPEVLPLSRFFEGPAGTQIELTLRRGDKLVKVTAALKNILPPDSAAGSN